MPSPYPAWLTKAGSKLAALVIFAGVGAGTGALMLPHVPDQLPPYADDSLGKIASRAVRLTRDYDVPDPEATERAREAAVADVRPVYDLDAMLQVEVESRITEGFELARTAPTGQSLEPVRRELMGRLQTAIDPKDFTALSKEGFTPAAQEALNGLVRSELSQLILEDRALVEAQADRGIYVRRLPDGENQVITDLDALRDLPAARSEVERLAEALPGKLSPAARRALGHIARGALRSNLTYDAGETARQRSRAREDVVPVVLHLSRGEQVLAPGDRIEPRHLLIFKALRSQARPVSALRTRVAGGLFAALLVFLCYRLVRTTLGHRPSRRDALFLGLVLLTNLAMTQAAAMLCLLIRQGVLPAPNVLGQLTSSFGGLDPLDTVGYAMPLAAGTIMVRLLLGPELVGLYATASGALFGLLHDGSFTYALYALAAGLVAGRRARSVSRPRDLLRVGAFIASTNVGVILCSELLAGRLFEHQTVAEVVAGLVGGLLVTPVVVALVAPVFEAIFGYLGDVRLLGLCNLNQPALKELIVRAPGTYHHSIVLASLAENAAQAIGANPLLARAIGLYHDLGKGKAPLVFSENQKSRSDVAAPEELAELVRKHVADGVELGRRHKLPRVLLEAIAEHHGTRAVGVGTLEGQPALHYAGPKPRRRETALVMLADAVEAQSRKLTTRDAGKLEDVIKSIVARIASEGQLDDCDLGLGDLPKITASLTQGLAQVLAERGTEPPAAIERPVGPSRTALEIN